ncbi:MAG: NERD domain-containing protein [Desulfuromusa sp.]
MNMIPSHPYITNSKAEYRCFKKLQEAYVTDNSFTAFHSLNLTGHKTKRFGEADFVILCKYGIFVLEIKGGSVWVEDGRWYGIGENNEKFRGQDPFRQAETALHAIEKAVREAGIYTHSILPIGYGVVFPDVKWDQKSSEWDRHTICDRNDFKNLERWLKSFLNYWKSKPANKAELSSEEIRDIKQFLRPDFEIIEPLNEKLSKVEESAVKLTEDQYKYLDIVAANKRVLCAGGAGTGKTFLAAELARRFGDGDKEVAFICKSNWLRRYLEPRICNEHIILSTVESAVVDKRRAGIDKYDILIVDEGQDLFNFEDIEIIESILDGGLKDGEWYIFHDINNQSGLFAKGREDINQAQEILEYLQDYTPTNIPLTTNCRNTKTILNKIQDSLQLDMGNQGTGVGPKIYEFNVTENNAADLLNNELSRLLKEGVSSGSITILSPLNYEKSLVSRLPEHIKSKIIKLDDFSVRSFPINDVSFSRIKDFKGLENEVIIVIDLICPENINITAEKVNYYVAMSRARGLLCLIWNN